MKYMTMKEKAFAFSLQLFAGDDGGSDAGNDESSRDDPEKTEAIKKATKLEVKVACFEAELAVTM